MVAGVAETVGRLRSEQQVLLKKAGPYFRAAGGNEPSEFTLRRWALHGIRGGIRLETYRSGRNLVTSVEAINRFITAITADRPTGPAADPPGGSPLPPR